jgi:hypothetical protein
VSPVTLAPSLSKFDFSWFFPMGVCMRHYLMWRSAKCVWDAWQNPQSCSEMLVSIWRETEYRLDVCPYDICWVHKDLCEIRCLKMYRFTQHYTPPNLGFILSSFKAGNLVHIIIEKQFQMTAIDFYVMTSFCTVSKF